MIKYELTKKQAKKALSFLNHGVWDKSDLDIFMLIPQKPDSDPEARQVQIVNKETGNLCGTITIAQAFSL